MSSVPQTSTATLDLLNALYPQYGAPSQQQDLLQIIQSLASVNIAKATKESANIDYASSQHDYSQYLQIGNSTVKALAAKIVSPSDSNDKKAEKITDWVINNIKYVTDQQQYGVDDYWAKPTETLASGKGDCEDGAFLIHSLMLAAGVPGDRIRTYGGSVQAGAGASGAGGPTAGHGWTAYKRESDNQWVNLDWCYYPTEQATASRPTEKADKRYIDDYFYVTSKATVDTPYVNRVRNPDSYTANITESPIGLNVNTFA